MKFFLYGLVFFLGASSIFADSLPTPAVVDSETLFVPVGFDTNDEVVAILDGYLPNSCYKLAESSVALDSATNTFYVDQTARQFAGDCLPIPVPFTTVISLGTVKKGTYTVRTADGKLSETLLVDQASGVSPDSLWYAPVEQVAVMLNPATGRKSVVLEGRLTSNCFRVKEVKVLNHEKTIEVLPIIEAMEAPADGGTCHVMFSPFKVSAELPVVKRGRHLVHVRSLSGKSLNLVFSE